MKKAFDVDALQLLGEAAQRLAGQFADLPEHSPALPDGRRIGEVLQQVAERMSDNYPYFHPLYAGQMLKPPHPVAHMAYALAMYINPNNHALDGGRASSAMEKEAVREIAAMFGWKDALGHLCGGGTVANLEALWVAGRVSSGALSHPSASKAGAIRVGQPKKVVASTQAHYTHGRITGVLGIPFAAVECDARGRMDTVDLEAKVKGGDVGCVVATLGTTATGAVDPLPSILELKAKHGFRVHVDSAYGGYFKLAGNLGPEARAAFERIHEADSIVVDPHKHGLQPYGCGCVVFKDPLVGTLYKHDSPYTYFTSSGDLHLGEITLECSRPGAGAVALWATQKLLPLERGGEFAKELEACREAALELYRRLAADERFTTPFPPELDIVVWAPQARSANEASAKSRLIFEAAARRGLHLALASLPAKFFAGSGMQMDSEYVGCLRSVLMKPEHKHWVERIYGLLDESTRSIPE